MAQDLQSLVELQELDLRIHELEQSKIEFPEEVLQLEATLKNAREELEAIHGRLEQASSEIAATRQESSEASENLDKSQERLNTITTNREYDAVHTEIDTCRSRIANAQVKLKSLDEETGRLTAQGEEAEKKLEALKEENEPKIADLKEKIATIDGKIAEVVAQREALRPRVPRPFLSVYEFISKKRENRRALSIVDDKRICSVCHKVLEPQRINEAKKASRLVQCESCGSILLWGGKKPRKISEEKQSVEVSPEQSEDEEG